MAGGLYIDEWGAKPPVAQPSGTSGAPAYTGPGTATAPPPAAPPAAPAGQVQTTAGYTPDYNALLTSDPQYLAAQAAATKSGADASAARRAALRQAVVRYGGMPAGFTDQYGDLDAGTLDLAKGNQQSVLANLATNYAQSEEQFKRGLAARGALQSGDLNYGEDQLSRGLAQQQYDAANQVGDQATGVMNQYTGVLNQNAQNMVGAIGSAESNVLANPAYKPSAATHADYSASASAQYGQPIYDDGSGNLYDSNGQPWSPPSAAPAAPGAPASDNTFYQYNPATQAVTSREGRPLSGLWMQ